MQEATIVALNRSRAVVVLRLADRSFCLANFGAHARVFRFGDKFVGEFGQTGSVHLKRIADGKACDVILDHLGLSESAAVALAY